MVCAAACAGLGLPSATALADLLARQVALTRDFIETQKRLHQCLLTNLECSEYRYTTLEETKQVTRCSQSPYSVPLLLSEEVEKTSIVDLNLAV